MQLKFYTLPLWGEERDRIAEEMNAFLRGHRVLNVQRQLVEFGERSCWTCCIEYIESATPDFGRNGKVKIDYRQILDEQAFAKFRLMRECRKQLADEDAVPPFAVFLDEQLAEFAKMPSCTIEAMQQVHGVGAKKTEKYGTRFIQLMEQKRNETDGKSLPDDSGNE